MTLKKALLFIAGSLSLFLGFIGIVIPLLPTTPLLLISAACFLRSSEPLYRWITRHRIFGRYISNYIKYRAVSLKAKIVALTLLWVLILFSIFNFQILWLRMTLLAVAIGVSIHLLILKTLTPDMIEEEKENDL